MEEKIVIALTILIVVCFGLLVYANHAMYVECKEAGGVLAGSVCIDKSVVVKKGGE